ncbi:hypothetical protein RJT34_02076 [Clitoria ternatea]|uniref:J domain-containing protein n=1 Tax=Clitoria ternatea TaxID=43366 RepID=A0AAN9KIQ1_CLITE
MKSGTDTHKGVRYESDSILRSTLSHLTRRDFGACRASAHCLPRSDPNISLQLDQILAVADVLASAERCHGTHHLDWYSVLQLRPSNIAAERDLIRQQFKTLVRLLDPNKNKFPFADEALMRVREAWSVLSDPVQKDRFDRELSGATVSFWTLCPYCWYLHEYERKYEDCTLRCTNCQSTFHGAAVRPPPPETVLEGKEEYYCYHVSLPLRYPVDERRRFGISDDGDLLNGGGRKRLRVKTVANRVRMKGFVETNSDSD